MSWFSQFLHSLANGAIAKPPETHADSGTNPVHAAVDSLNQAGAQIGAAVSTVAQSEVTGLVAKYAGGPTGLIAGLFLQALVTEAQAQLEKAVPAATPPTA